MIKTAIFLNHDSIKGKPSKERLIDDALYQVALAFAGDNGQTAKGTADAMAWASRVRTLPVGRDSWIDLSRGFYLTHEEVQS